METVAEHEDTRTRILRVVREHPDFTLAQIAAVAKGVTPQRVQQILSAEGYRREWHKPPSVPR